jgi:GntR family transcriptional regulator/MocR family aminotransferase
MDLFVALDRDGAEPLHRQVTAQLRAAVLDGRLPPGARLPSTRGLAASLGVSRNVVVAAYDDLLAEGYLDGRHGAGTFVAPALRLPTALPATPDGGAPDAPRWLRQPPPPPQPGPDPAADLIEFRPGRPSVGPLPATVWRRVWRSVAEQPPPDDYGPPAGDPALRAALARHVGQGRGVHCAAEDVVVTSGAVQAIDLVARATLGPGDPVALEEPGPAPARNILLARGARVVPVPVDEDGLRVDQLPTGAGAPLLVYVTPSHQYPLGGRLPVARRLALLEWARREDALIVEDDYDTEFRYDAAPLPALAGLDPGGRVAYVGTFSKVLTPALRIGFLVAPPLLRERVERLKPVSDYHCPWPVQRALTELLEGGHLARHVRRMRRHYAARRAALLAALAPVADLARPLGLEAGLHLCLEFRPDLDDERVAATARAGGVAVQTLRACYAGPPDRSGLLLGYGGLSLAEIERGGAVLVAAIRREGAERVTR